MVNKGISETQRNIDDVWFCREVPDTSSTYSIINALIFILQNQLQTKWRIKKCRRGISDDILVTSKF